VPVAGDCWACRARPAASVAGGHAAHADPGRRRRAGGGAGGGRSTASTGWTRTCRRADTAHFTAAVLQWRGRSVRVLDDQHLLSAVKRSLS
jgi:hypothetical protein